MRKLVTVFVTGLATLTVAGCDVEQTREAKLPKVDVSVEKGQLPEYEIKQTKKARMPDVDIDVESGQLPEVEVETANIEIGRQEVSVPVPDVELKDKKVTVPSIDIEMPNQQDAANVAREKGTNEKSEGGS